MTRPWLWCAACFATLVLAGAAMAQPTFGPKKPKAKPPEGQAEPNGPGPMDPKNPGVTQPPPEWYPTDPERKEPTWDATPGTYYCWKTADGLRYSWSLPVKFVKGEGYDLIVLLHPDRMDFRWGHSNHPRDAEGGFRPDCIVVAVDGLAANAKRAEARTFECTGENCVRFRDVMLEFSRNLPVRHIYLYGQGGGGKFAAYFSGSFPALAEGVLDHGGGIADNSAVKSTVPIVFMHGAKDSLTPLKVSYEAKSEYEAKGHKAVRVRVLREYNDFPNPNSAGDCIDFLRGTRSDDPAEVIAVVKRLLEPKGPDEFSYRTIPWFAGARALLKKFEDGPEKFEKTPNADLAKQAQALIDKIEAEGEAHAGNARILLKASGVDKGDFVLDGGAWLGYVLALRDDFRGVKSVEKLVEELKLDAAIAKHAEESQDLWVTWSTSASDSAKFERAVEQMPKCYLFESLPVDLLPRTRAILRKADELEIEAELRNKHENIVLWDKGWREGLEAYQLRWREWTGVGP